MPTRRVISEVSQLGPTASSTKQWERAVGCIV